LVEEVASANPELLDEESVEALRGCVGFHYGQFAEDSNWRRHLPEMTNLQACVFLADYVASRRGLPTPF
jgi:hypothetical protein